MLNFYFPGFNRQAIKPLAQDNFPIHSVTMTAFHQQYYILECEQWVNTHIKTSTKIALAFKNGRWLQIMLVAQQNVMRPTIAQGQPYFKAHSYKLRTIENNDHVNIKYIVIKNTSVIAQGQPYFKAHSYKFRTIENNDHVNTSCRLCHGWHVAQSTF